MIRMPLCHTVVLLHALHCTTLCYAVPCYAMLCSYSVGREIRPTSVQYNARTATIIAASEQWLRHGEIPDSGKAISHITSAIQGPLNYSFGIDEGMMKMAHQMSGHVC